MRLQTTIAVVIGALLWWRVGGRTFAIVFSVASVAAAVAWVSPRHFRPIQRALDFVTQLIVKAISWLLLAVVYFGVFTPGRLFFRLRGKELLARKPAHGEATALVPLAEMPADHFKRQY